MMSNQLYPCLWFDGEAAAAAEFYCSIFPQSKITHQNPMVVIFELAGKKFMGLNGGPVFTINPSISMFVNCDTEKEAEDIWNKLMEGGSALMALDTYPWSKKYGWVKDKFGMTWQVMLNDTPVLPKIIPSFLFANKQYGNASKALHFYTSIFPNSTIESEELYEANETQTKGNLKFGRFTLNGSPFVAMDGPGNHEFTFNEGLSLVVDCDTQEEIDFYWNKLTEGGEESQCGWLKDQFGVSWQIVPTILGSLMRDPNKAPRVVQAFMKMKKFDIEGLMNA